MANGNQSDGGVPRLTRRRRNTLPVSLIDRRRMRGAAPRTYTSGIQTYTLDGKLLHARATRGGTGPETLGPLLGRWRAGRRRRMEQCDERPR